MSQFQYRNGDLYCEDVSVANLAERFGTPLWIYSKAFLLGQLQQLQNAFAEVDPVICYSVKANSTLGILRVMHDAGISFDVVSGGELYRVKAAGVTHRRWSSQAWARRTRRFDSHWKTIS